MKNLYSQFITVVAPFTLLFLLSSFSFAQTQYPLYADSDEDTGKGDYYWNSPAPIKADNDNYATSVITHNYYNPKNAIETTTEGSENSKKHKHLNNDDSAPADITIISPGSACVGSGETITITGSNFTGATAFYFNGTPAAFTVDSDTQITAIFPNGATTGHLSVTTSDGTFIDNATFIVKTHPTAPTSISGVTSICNGNSTTLTRSGGSLGIYASAEWYSGSCGGTYLGSGPSITVSPTTDTTYFVRYEGDCSTTVCAQVTVTVGDTTNPTITLIGANPQTIEACDTYSEFNATANDNCSGNISGSIVIDASAVNTATVGSYAVTYNVSDSEGNPASQVTRTVNVVDTTSPIITLNGPATVNLDACDTYNELGATANDGCLAIGSVTIGGDTVDTTTVGSYTVTYNVSDNEGNPAIQLTRTVNVLDITSPIITLNGPATVNLDACDTYNELGATANDGCLAIGAVTIGGDTVDTTTVGSYTVTYNVSDNEGNPAIQLTRTVNVLDTTSPIITLNGPATVNLDACDTYNELGATANDGCLAIGAVTIGGDTVDTTTVGSYTVTYNVSDNEGNPAIQLTRTVNVLDTTSPIITLNGPATVNLEACDTYNELGATANDGCLAIGAVTIGGDTVDTTTVGSYTVTYNVSDNEGNPAIQLTRTVNVVDTTSPIITLNGPATVNLDACDTYNELGATANDGCLAIGAVTIGGDTVDTTTVGSYTVTYNVSDNEGNPAIQLTRTVNVLDTTSPIITLNGPATVNLDACDTYNELGATANDGCLAIGTVTIGGDTVDTTTVGSYTVTYNVSDNEGNPAIQLTRTVNVLDTTSPIITLNGPATVNLEACDTYNELGATANDGCLAIGAVTIGGDTVDTTTVGSYTVTYNVSDNEGNPAIQLTRTVNVLDTTSPIITLNGPATVNLDACDTYNELGATANDGCLAIGAVTIGGDTVDTTTVGSYTVTYNVSDNEGNPAIQLTRTVNVLDTTSPIITLNGPATVNLEACDTYNELGATANDGCLAIGAVTIGGDTVDTTTVGSYTVTYNVSDNEGNPAIQLTRTVNVLDTTSPIITLNGPATVNLEACDTYNELGATANDGCLAIGAVTIGGDTVDTTTVGSYTVTYNVSDNEGNPAIQLTRTVNVLDTTSPIITLNGPATVNLDACDTYNELGATANDGCLAIGSVTIGGDTVDTTTVGTYTVTYNVSDNEGNPAIQLTRTVNVLDTTSPIITLNGPATVNLDACDTYNELGATANDGCLAIGSVTIGGDTVDTTTVGSYTVTYNVSDNEGNPAIQLTRTVNVVDTTNPTITLNGAATITVEACDTYNELGATANDGCLAIGAVTIGGDTVDTTTVGSYTITYNVSDNEGNPASQVTRTVNVLDTTNPTITLNGAATITVEACDTYNELGATANDGCLAIGSVSIGGDTVDTSTVGTYTITYNVSDNEGNPASQVTRTVNVVDTTNPTITLNGAATITVEACDTYNELGATADDGCLAIGSVSIGGDTVDTSTVGTYTITYNVSDNEGNPAIQLTRTVNVVDTTPATPNLIPLPNITAQCSVNSLTPPTATDSCLGIITATTMAILPITSQGTTVITWTYDDGNGNLSTQTQNVIITDTTNPIVVCQNFTVTLDAGGNASITTADIDNGSSDNCAISSMDLDTYNFSCADIGTNTVTLTVYDTSGNSDSCTATVTVVDPAANASVTITSNDVDNEICLGENVTFTATPANAGTSQFYTWFINGVDSGTTTVPTFTPLTPPTADYSIFIEMTTDLSACNPKTSNTINITVHPLPIVSVSDYDFCIDDNSQSASPSTGGTWVSSNTSIATINNSGAITPVSDGTVTFTFLNTTTGCSTSTNAVTISPLPSISNYPLASEICENEMHELFPSSGGTWVSSNPSIASISNSGVITGISVGSVNFTYTNSTTGCSVTSASITVLEVPVIDSLTVSDSPVCAGDPSILTANVAGASLNAETIVNYDFNSGNSYGALVDISTTLNIDSDFYSPGGGNNIPFNNTGNGSLGGPFTYNSPRGNSLIQIDDYRDGGWLTGGSDDSGMWRLNVDGADLATFKNIRIGFHYRRDTRFGDNKTIRVQYRVGNSGGWTTTNVSVPNSNAYYTNWREANIALPTSFDNASLIQFRLRVDDGSDYNFSLWDGITDIAEPHIYIDNLQVQGAKAGTDFEYSWSANTGANAGLPADATIPSTSNSQITVNPEITTDYTLTVTNNDGCPTTETVTVNVYPSPEVSIIADYCPVDDPATAQDESNMVQLVATSTQPIATWEWNTGETTSTIYVDTAGVLQVIGTTTNGCSDGATLDISQELVINGTFSNPKPTTDGPFADDMASLGFDYDQDYSWPYTSGYRYFEDPILYQNRITITDNVQPFYPGIFRSVTDHTGDGAGQYLAVNGNDLTLAVWRQEITVKPNTDYYFSAWGIDISNASNSGLRPSDLTFRINGTDVGSTLDLVKGADWERFYGIWNSGSNTTAIVEIRNIDGDLQGNNFAIDDVSFATLSTFINQTSTPGTENQTICQNTPITDITFKVGGGLTGPSTIGLPAGITTTFDGLEYIISGSPTESGTFNYTISTNANCGNKTFSGTLIVNPEPVVTITTPPATVCASDGTIELSATLSGSATGGNWSIGGTTITTTESGGVATASYPIATTGPVTFTFTSNNPAGPCDEAIETIDFNITPYIIADANPNAIDYTLADCSATTIGLNANNVTGQWSATPTTGAFSNASAHNSSFTGESGTTYTLTWTATNASPCGDTTDTLVITIPDCGTSLVFDGGDDYISLGNDYNLNANFSIEAWIKTNTILGTKTIISKRNGTSTASGYDLSLINDRLNFRYNGSTVISNQAMNSSKWYHVAVTFSNSTYTLYIDGFPVKTSGGSIPGTNANKALIGAMDRTDNTPINYFDGKIDEVRIWNTNLSQDQIREMMNQEIKQNGSSVIGEVIPLNITGGLLWNNLIGYYQMSSGPQTEVSNGTVKDISTVSPNPGKLNAMTDNQLEDAPIPYVSRLNNSWDNATTWSATAVQQIPNSKTNNIVPNQLQTWNIVRTATNVIANRPITNPQLGKTTLLGLLVDSNRLNITNDQPIHIDKYLKIDGTLDLEDESQLLQPMGSIVDYTGTGKLERDQQGTSNMFNYNYWGSPVSNAGSSGNRTYALGSILYDGSNLVNWVTTHDTPGTTNPVTISSRWLYTYSNLSGSYDDWFRVNQNTGISVGLGYTMKGSGVGTSNQNYTFTGQPNNGTISIPISANKESLLGNPYPSAIDAHEFIDDNNSALLNGALIFWEQAPNNPNHILAEYLGRYSYLNKSGGLPATNSPGEIDGNGSASKIPKRYVPVAQGFFVEADTDGGTIIFENDQRIFKKESVSESVFLRGANDSSEVTLTTDSNDIDLIKRIRFGFKTPEGAYRHLLLGFTPNNEATDGVDYGYDALNSDYFPSDMSFLIDGENYVIQGVGEFDNTKVYPLEMVLGEQGNIEIGLTTLENFDEAIDVYIFDAVEGSYTRFNDVNFQMNLEAGTYSDRFFLVFQEDATLSTIKEEFKDIMVRYLHDTDEIYVKTPPSVEVKQLYLINVAGQTVASWNATNLPMSHEIKIPVKHISEGAYIIKAETKTSTFNKKIIIKY
ncbi:immunoglobulin-like domain-containing protein [Winogradskyella sp. PC D3.3]